ncbi:MAG: hypothetical protein ABFE01_23410 [Phycisphaerales bacterium]
MIFREETDQLNSVSRTRSVVERQYPDEAVLFASAATILETSRESPTGWSLRRVFQRRGSVVISDSRVFVQSSFLSVLTIMWAGVAVYGAFEYFRSGHIFPLILAIVAAAFIFQHRPYSRDVPFNSVDRVHFGVTHGLTGSCDIVSMVVHGRTIQVVTGHSIPGELRQRLTSLNRANQEQ